jgi:hypothetical protein
MVRPHRAWRTEPPACEITKTPLCDERRDVVPRPVDIWLIHRGQPNCIENGRGWPIGDLRNRRVLQRELWSMNATRRPDFPTTTSTLMMLVETSFKSVSPKSELNKWWPGRATTPCRRDHVVEPEHIKPLPTALEPQRIRADMQHNGHHNPSRVALGSFRTGTMTP